MTKSKRNIFLIINILAPILIGATIYYLISPDVIFVKQIDTFLGKGIHINHISSTFKLIKFIRNYILDMIWGYALIFSLFYILGNNTAELLKIFLIAFTFSAVMEFLQLTSITIGTFDVFDIIVEFLTEVTAVFIIKNYFLRGGTKET